ncbi:hypothetical protein [Streptococcus uberis]|uniref:hypothetical protein n=1 Tax=Streptococcus uberis TaxID=1349 RepID=UPI00193A3449|nr:hypothetical protein [Streptococcus uberis]
MRSEIYKRKNWETKEELIEFLQLYKKDMEESIPNYNTNPESHKYFEGFTLALMVAIENIRHLKS